MLAALGACVVNTSIVVWMAYEVRANKWFCFLIAAGGQATNLIVVSGLMVLLGIKRNVNVKGGKDGAEVSISDTGA